MRTLRLAWVTALLLVPVLGSAHPLRLSPVNRIFKPSSNVDGEFETVFDRMNEALVFDPYSRALRFAEADESENAGALSLLLAHLDEFFR